MSLKRIAMLSIGLSALSACGGIGDGSRPEELIVMPVTLGVPITDEDLDSAPESTSVTQCLGGNLGLFIRFTNGSVGDFTTRATWESRDPDVVRVSNFDLSVLDSDLFFTSGALVPVSPGTTTVDVTYNGLTESIDVTVEPADLDSFRLTPSTQVMAPRTFAQFNAVGNIEGVADAPINQFVTFDLLDVDSEVAELGDGTVGNVTAISASENSATVRARFNAADCPVDQLTAEVRVAELQGMTLEQEDGFYPQGSSPDEQRMTVGYSQFLQVIGSFGDIDLDGDGQPDTQDLATQPVLELSAEVTDPIDEEESEGDATVVVTFGSPLFGRANQIVGSLAGSANISASFPGAFGPDGEPDTEDDGATTQSNVVPVTIVGREDEVDPLQDIAVSPTSASIDQPFGTAPFTALGGFLFEDGSTLSHDVTRHVFWSIVDPNAEEDAETDESTDETEAVATISNFPNSNEGGVAQSLLALGDDPATVTVRAFRLIGLADTDPLDPTDPLDLQRDATLNLSAPAQ